MVLMLVSGLSSNPQQTPEIKKKQNPVKIASVRGKKDVGTSRLF